REHAGSDVVAILLPGLSFGQPDACDLRVGVDRPRHRSIVDGGVVTAGVLGGHLPLPERRVCELPIASAVADGVDVRNRRSPMLVGGDPFALVEFDADVLDADSLDLWPAADRYEH